MNSGPDFFTHKSYLPDVAAHPESVNILEGSERDMRTPDKLVDGINDTFDGRHMWLSPILPNQVCGDKMKYFSKIFLKNLSMKRKQ